MRIPAIPDVLPDISLFLANLGKKAQITEKDAFRLRLAVEEVIMNVNRNADFGDQNREIKLDVSVGYYRVLVQLVDTAQKFDPSTEPHQDELPVRLLRCSADRVIYERVGSLNRTIIVVRRSDRRLADVTGRRAPAALARVLPVPFSGSRCGR